MPSHWANAHGGYAVWPRLEKAHHLIHIILSDSLVTPLPHHQESFCLSTKNKGQVDIFP